MTRFSYTAKTKQGAVLRDVIEAESRPKALASLRILELTVVSLTEMEAGLTGGRNIRSRSSNANEVRSDAVTAEKTPFWKREFFKGAEKVKVKDMAVFCRQLAISVNSGLPLRDALAGINEDMDVPDFKKILDQILTRLHNGEPFSKAIAAHPKVFSPVFIGLVRAAEESGSMGETMTRLADYIESSDRLRRKVGSMMAYPAFVGVFFILISMVMVFFIVPQFQDIFLGLGSDLPPLTRFVFSANHAIMQQAPLIAIVIGLIAGFFYLYRRSPGGKLNLASLQLKMPWIGECIKQYVIARVCRCLAIMLKSGVPIATGLQIVAKVGNNLAIETSLIEARNKTVGGANIADSLAETGIFPSLLIRMVKVGENAGRLPEVLDNVAGAYEDRVENTLTTGMALFEPVIIVVFGALVLVLVISIYLPIMTVASHV